MARTIDQIEERIAGSRHDLRSNLDELSQKVKSAVDWRQRVRSNPGAVLAIAFGGGLLLAAALGRTRGASTAVQVLPASVATGRSRVMKAWDDIQTALVGVLAQKASTTLADVVPGFKEQIVAHKTEATSPRAH
jgi:hypothetical protein